MVATDDCDEPWSAAHVLGPASRPTYCSCMRLGLSLSFQHIRAVYTQESRGCQPPTWALRAPNTSHTPGDLRSCFLGPGGNVHSSIRAHPKQSGAHCSWPPSPSHTPATSLLGWADERKLLTSAGLSCHDLYYRE